MQIMQVICDLSLSKRSKAACTLVFRVQCQRNKGIQQQGKKQQSEKKSEKNLSGCKRSEADHMLNKIHTFMNMTRFQTHRTQTKHG